MAEYLKIVMQNLEPLRFSDASASQSGQTMTLRHIPGTALRGIVVNALAVEAGFAQMKKALFSPKVRYLNAYVTDGDKELIPSPKGFYEDKAVAEGKKELQNVVLDGEFSEGMKRAALGRFCCIEDGCIGYYQVDTGSDIKIKINLQGDEEQTVFRNEYIAAGHVFTGYIAIEEEGLKEPIQRVFSQDIILGNGRTAGLGKCKVLSCAFTNQLPYEGYLAKEDQPGSCYMMLLSHTAMRGENGEVCGLDCEKLGKLMGVEGLKIRYCSTSTVVAKGYSRIWETATPSAVMYEQGSVFHLEYQGTLTRETMRAICGRGIGIRVNEGFGRVMFLDHYERVRYKEARQYTKRIGYGAGGYGGSGKADEAGAFGGSGKADGVGGYGGSGKADGASEPGKSGGWDAYRQKEDGETLKIAARSYYRNLLMRAMNRYVVEHPIPKGKVSNSQLGTLESLATAYKYEPKEAKEAIQRYLGHAGDKEENSRVQKEKSSMRELKKYVSAIFSTDLEELLSVHTKQAGSVMGVSKSEIFPSAELDRMRLELITQMIRYDNKKEGE